MTAQAIARELHGHRSGSSWLCRCPAHDDRNPSLAVRERDGRILLYCHAGCPQSAVVEALRSMGLWESERREHPEDWGVIVQTYDYTDEQGRLLYQVCRFSPKSFRPRRPDGMGGWRWGYGEVRRVPYRLREVIEASIVFVVEGERDTETLREWGFVATTNSGGANGWRDEFNPVFAGKEVLIIPDNDTPGFERAKRIARGVLPYAAKVSIITLDDGSKDISEWFERGHRELELIAMVGEGAHAH